MNFLPFAIIVLERRLIAAFINVTFLFVVDKCAFRITDLRPDGSSHTLHTKEEHDKRQWMNCIQKAVARENNSLFASSSCDSVPADIQAVGSSNSLGSSSLSSTNSTCSAETDSIPEETSVGLKQETVV